MENTKLCQCSSCPLCRGIEVIQNISAYKGTGQILSIDEIMVYKCDIFDYVTPESSCYEINPAKESNINEITWTEH